MEIADTGVSVHMVCPGPVQTPYFKRLFGATVGKVIIVIMTVIITFLLSLSMFVHMCVYVQCVYVQCVSAMYVIANEPTQEHSAVHMLTYTSLDAKWSHHCSYTGARYNTRY